MAALARHAVSRFRLVTAPEDGGSLRADLATLVQHWTRPLDREEKAVASLVGAARHEEELRAGLDAALVRPLAEVVAELGRRAERRGEPVDDGRLALLGSVLEAFWWQRYTAAGDGAMLAEQVQRVVDDVLLPIAAPGMRGARSEPATV
ncbi:TetR-like C-terminal domain-containing protein [Blastococcus sp. PRF04-17]|uniref:TetR-like C-terminal domain-containing protein n=1 Tax=Blastococcus sp. PRF04-17 TaxID=2933797 RepID=UPI001FF42B6B|nr:TetR-like C-terminal domain-containing protein [Blastococcus sp. PRF04-17]UOY00257.1 TetR/AcrR family transcriptional regulator C-terminal ligand-binding domain-containing protein [Blastococcus sp. PRF04-17]